MEVSSSMGGLIPLWILGAPLLGGLITLAITPKGSSRNDEQDLRDARASHSARPTLPVGGLSTQRL
jgi:hypothetical protein